MCETWETIQEKFRGIDSYERGVGRLEEARQIKLLADIAVTPAQKVYLLLQVVGVKLDSSIEYLRAIDSGVWKECVRDILVVLDLVWKYPNIVVGYTTTRGAMKIDEEIKKGEDYVGRISVYADLADVVESLSYNLFCNLKFQYPDSEEYKEMMNYEMHLIVVCENMFKYLERLSNIKARGIAKVMEKGLAKVAGVFLGLIYYKSAELYDEMLEHEGIDSGSGSDSGDAPRRATLANTSGELVDQLFSVINKFGDEQCKITALLNVSYYYALHDEVLKSKILLMKIEEDYTSVMQYGDVLQHNRVKAQFALCAFKVGEIFEAHRFLAELHDGGGGFIEQLGQGVLLPSYSEPSCNKSYEQEIKENSRFPSHMHIDVQLLEAVYQICVATIWGCKASSQSALLIKQKCDVKDKDMKMFLDNLSG